MNEKDYIEFKLKSLDSLIENATSNEQKEIYEGYKKEFIEKHGAKEKKQCPLCSRTLLVENYDDHYQKCVEKKEAAEKKTKEEADRVKALANERALEEERKKQEEIRELKKRLAGLEEKKAKLEHSKQEE